MASRKPEQLAWDAFKRAATTAHSSLDLTRIENRVGCAMPDVIAQTIIGTGVWLEFKAAEWPKRASTPALRGKFQPGQIPWAMRWNLRGGHSFIITRFGQSDWLLHRPQLRDIIDLEQATKDQLIESAEAIGLAKIISYLETL